MAGWLQKILSTSTTKPPSGNRLPATTAKATQLPAKRTARPSPPLPQELPTATIIYGIGASLVFLDSFFMLISWQIFSGIITFFIGGCLSGFALHHMKYRG